MARLSQKVILLRIVFSERFHLVVDIMKQDMSVRLFNCKRKSESLSDSPNKKLKLIDDDFVKSSLDVLRHVTLFECGSDMKEVVHTMSTTFEFYETPSIRSSFNSIPQQIATCVISSSPHPLQIEYRNYGKDHPTIEFKEYCCEEKSRDLVNLGPYLNMPQSKAAQKLGLPTSTLSKRWKEVVPNRKVCL